MNNKSNNSVLKDSWLLLLAGKERGISGLYDTMWEKMYMYASRILEDKYAAADVMQDLFIHLWEKREQLPEVHDVEGYLFKSLKHALLNHIHSAGIREKHLQAFQKVILKTGNDTLDVIYQKELAQRIRNSSERLPLRMKEIFLMNRFEHKSVTEIARELNLSEQTVRNQINLALKKIKPSIVGASLIALLSLYQYYK